MGLAMFLAKQQQVEDGVSWCIHVLSIKIPTPSSCYALRAAEKIKHPILLVYKPVFCVDKSVT